MGVAVVKFHLKGLVSYVRSVAKFSFSLYFLCAFVCLFVCYSVE